MQAGAAKIDITPPLGTLINGDFVTHYATHIHSNLYAKALVLERAGVSIAICIVDICAMRRQLIDAVKKQVQQLTGIPPQQVLISSTHTHAAGSVESLLLGAADEAYRQKLPALIVQTIVAARQNSKPAKLGFGSVMAPEYVLCRRYTMKEGFEARNPVTGGLDKVKTNPFGAENQIVEPTSRPDAELCYIAIKNEQDEWISVLANFSLHYVGDWENGTISADYFGEFCTQLQTKLGADDSFVGMLSNGTSGEVNIWDFLHNDRFPTAPFEKSKLIGSSLAEKVVQSLSTITWQTEAVIAVQYNDVPVPLRKPNKEELEAAKIIVADSHYEQLSGIDYDTMHRLYAREQVLLNEFPDIVDFPVQAFKMGNIIIGALGGEFFAETGLWLKQNSSAKQYFTITLANDYVGYVCPEHEIEKGGYETWRCRTSCLNEAVEQVIRQQLLQMIETMQH